MSNQAAIKTNGSQKQTAAEVVHKTAKVCIVRKVGKRLMRMFVFNKTVGAYIDVTDARALAYDYLVLA